MIEDDMIKVGPIPQPNAVESSDQGLKEKNAIKKEKKRAVKNPGKTTTDDDVITKPKKTTYGNTNINKLVKPPKSLMTDIDKLPALSEEQMEKYLTAIILGLVPDKFGLEVGADTKIKAISELTKLKQLQSQAGGGLGEEQVVIIDDIPSDITI